MTSSASLDEGRIASRGETDRLASPRNRETTIITEPSPTARHRPRGLLRWCFESRQTGRIVVAQAPNWPLWLFIVALLIEIVLHPGGRLGLAVRIVKIAGLTIWALDEILRGVNPWRRALGAGVLVYEAIGLVW